MIKLAFYLLLAMGVASVSAQETISIYSPAPIGAATNASKKVYEVANKIQTKYQFILHPRPGAQGLLAIKELDKKPESSLAVVHTSFVDLIEENQITESDYVPIHSLGDACWAVVSLEGDPRKGIESLSSSKEIAVGSVASGNVTHLIALEIGARYNIPVKLIFYKSNNDALLAMLGNHGVTFTTERINLIDQLKEKYSTLKILAVNCPARHRDFPDIKTLREQGVRSPYVFHSIVAHQKMPPEKARELGKILDDATLMLGEDEIRKLSDLRPSIFDKIPAEKYHHDRVNDLKKARQPHRSQINASK